MKRPKFGNRLFEIYLQWVQMRGLREYFYLTLTFGIGIALTFFLFFKTLRLENDKYQNEFYADAAALSSRLDLTMANETIRLQNFEESLFHGSGSHKVNRQLIDAVLKGSVFSVFTSLNMTGRESDGLPRLVRTVRIEDEKNEKILLPPLNPVVENLGVRRAVDDLIRTGSKHRSILVERDGRALYLLVWRSSTTRNRFFIFSGMAHGLVNSFLKLKPGMSFVLHQYKDDTHWLVDDPSGAGARVRKAAPLEISEHMRRTPFTRDFDLRLSGEGAFKITVLAQRFDEAYVLWPTTVLGGGVIITLLISLLVYYLISRNIQITELVKRKTADLEVESRRAMDAAESKTRFLANVSHEIRTPLNIILGMAEIATDEAVSDKQKEHLQTLSSAGTHLLALIDDILDMAKVDSSDVRFHEARVDLLQFAEEMCQLVQPNMAKKKLKFYFEMDPALPKAVSADPARMRQILINLINNSIKFTDKGFIALSLRRAPARKDEGGIAVVEFKIKDSGIGIPDLNKNEVFKAFYQVNPSTTRSQGGVGLGLAIVNAIVQRLKGSIHVQSKMNEGSTFSVRLPLKIERAAPWRDQMLPSDAEPLNVLAICRDDMLWEGIQSFFKGTPHRLRRQSVPSRAAIEESDVVICDGDETPMDFPALKHMVGKRRLVVLSDQTESWLAEDVSVLSKPPLPSNLFEAVGLIRPREMKRVETPAPRPVDEHISLVIADDDDGNRTLMKAYTDQKTWRVRFAVDGQEALDMCIDDPPDVLVADLQMPVLDGFSLVEKLRAFESYKGIAHTRVIMLTADALAETAQKARERGVDVFLTKPIRKKDFFSAVENVSES
ncbi:MAG TPA: ATP-binding protein [Bdellovibrionales bacterium]|nr:ATP-binding protein [Bdellovibrionales bacterium]